jgi:glycosyltransferase involved in cell wall biosynthesis
MPLHNQGARRLVERIQMKIAQVAPLWESVPPKLYGGTERIVSYVTEELVRLGHDVTLFASGDSNTAARLDAVCPQALRLNTGIFNREAPLTMLQERALGAAADFDIIHSHLDFVGFPLARRNALPVVTTLHGRLDLPELVPVFREFADMPLVSISDAQRLPISWANWQATIHHGLPRDLYSFHPQSEGYLAFLGRIATEKRPDQAVEVAKRTGRQLRMAAKVDPADQQYYQTEIEPLLDHPLVEFLGEISDAEKNDFIGHAAALVCPYDWPEPFGLVLIEALACGTPVIAYRRGSIPEIIEDGVTGFVCETLAEMAEAVQRIPLLDRRRCRAAFEERFTADRMARDYVALYERIVEERTVLSRASGRAGHRPVTAAVLNGRPHERALSGRAGRHA